MNVKELIEYLQTQPQDIPVAVDGLLLCADAFNIQPMRPIKNAPWRVEPVDNGQQHLHIVL